MDWWMWLIVGLVGIVGMLFLLEVKRPGSLNSINRGLDKTDAGMAKTSAALNRTGYAITALITLPVLGVIFFGWGGLIVGLVIGVLLVGRR